MALIPKLNLDKVSYICSITGTISSIYCIVSWVLPCVVPGDVILLFFFINMKSNY